MNTLKTLAPKTSYKPSEVYDPYPNAPQLTKEEIFENQMLLKKIAEGDYRDNIDLTADMILMLHGEE